MAQNDDLNLYLIVVREFPVDERLAMYLACVNRRRKKESFAHNCTGEAFYGFGGENIRSNLSQFLSAAEK